MAEAPDRLVTQRLVGTRLAREDLRDFQAYYADAAVMRTLSADGRPWPRSESKHLFSRHIEHWREHGFGTWMFRDRDDGRFVGRAGLRVVRLVDQPEPEVEVFYGVASDRWGSGLGTELATEIVRVGFDELGLPGLVGFTLPTNTASRRILEGRGFQRTGEITHAGLRHLLFRLQAPAEG